MNKVLFAVPFLAVLAGSFQARAGLMLPPPPLPNTQLDWMPYQKLPESAGEVSIGASVAIDSGGVAHFAKTIFIDNKYQLWYFNTRYETRGIAGFGPSELIDEAIVAVNEGLGRPDIAIGPDDSVHIAWIHRFGLASELRHARSVGGGPFSVTILNARVDNDSFIDPQLVISQNGKVHFVYVRYDSNPNPDIQQVEHRILTLGAPNTITTHPITGSLPSVSAGSPRIALRGNTIYAVWVGHNPATGQIQHIYASQGSITGSWGAQSLISSGAESAGPDVAIDYDGVPHFAWCYVGNATIPPTIWFRKGGDAEEQVSVSELGPNPPLEFRSARVRLDGTRIHVFYDGFSHAVKGTGSMQTQWAVEEPVTSPNSSTLRADSLDPPPNPPHPMSPMEVTEYRGRFDLVDEHFYLRTYDTLPDGAAWVPAFPGASVNLVPLSGTLRYRLNLFATNGVGPCTSVGLTYNTKQSVASLTGPGWTMDHMMYITVTGPGEDIMLTLPSGFQLNFKYNATIGHVLEGESFGFAATIKQIAGNWTLIIDGGTEYIFNQFGKLGTIRDPMQNYLAVNYFPAGPNVGMPSEIVDMLGNVPGNGGLGRTTTLTYGTTGADARRVTKVTDPTGKEYDLIYMDTSLGRQLQSVIFKGITPFPTYSFEYGTNGMMSKVTTPRGNSYDIQYDSAGRFKYVDDPSEAFLAEGGDDNTPPVTQRARFEVSYNDRQNLLPGKFHSRVTNRRLIDSFHVFDAQRNFAVTEVWDAAAIALIGQPNPRFLPVIRTFDTFGNVLTEKDRWGFTTTYTYEQRGAGHPAVWIRNLLQSVRRPSPSGAGDQLVEEFTYTQDAFSTVASHTTYVDGVGRTISYDHDAFGRITFTHFPNVTLPDGTQQQGVQTENVYSSGLRKQLIRVVNEENHYTDFSDFHDKHALPKSILREGGSQAELTDYDAMGNVTKTKRPDGAVGNDPANWTEFVLDGLYRVWKVKDPLLNETINEYDSESHLIKVTPPAPAGATETHYDNRGLVKGGTSPDVSSLDGVWKQVVDANGNVRRKSSIRNSSWNTCTDYDSLDRLTEVRAPGETTLGAGQGGGGPFMITQWSHDNFDEAPTAQYYYSLETRIGVPNRVSKTIYDHRRRPTRVIAPDQKTHIENFYNEQDQVVATQTRYGSDFAAAAFQTATLTYRDARDRVYQTRVQNAPYGQTPTLKSDTVSIYNKVGSVVKAVDPLGYPTIVTGPLAYPHKTTYLLDARERVVQVLDGNGAMVRENLWGDDDLLVEVKIPDPATKTPDMVRSEVRTYTARKELKTLKNRNNVGVTYAYNAIQGQVDTVTDALGRITKTTYDPLKQRVDEVIVAYGSQDNERRTKSLWEGGLLKETKVWNPTPGVNQYNSSYFYFYDKADRLERFEAPQVGAERHSYTAFGQEFEFITDSTPEKRITHSYNELGQRVFSTWTGAFSQTETRTYNPAGLLESVASGSLKKEMLYDVWQGTLGVELFYVQDVYWKAQAHYFDEAKNYRQMIDSASGGHEWVFDGNNRVSQIRYGPQPVVEIFYTVGGLIDRTLLRDAAGIPIAETTHNYDGLGRRIRQQTAKLATGEVLADFEWEYDDLDLVTVVKVNHLGVRGDFRYNERRELDREIWTGNNSGQSAPPYTNQLGGPAAGPQSIPSTEPQASLRTALAITPVTKEYDYDRAGNRKWIKVDGVQTTYTFNSASQLTVEDLPGVRTISHLYDQWGNEYSRTTTPSGGVSVTETYGYNYLNLLSSYLSAPGANAWQYAFWPTGERYSKSQVNDPGATELYIPRAGDVVTEYSNPTTLKNTYVQGTGIDSKTTRISLGGQRRHYLGDSVGTVSITLTDAALAAETSLKDVWGGQIAGATGSERYGFAQRELDGESSLVHMRARMYDPRTGRFTQTDPILGNRPSQHYAYAANNPITLVDPFGLAPGDWWDPRTWAQVVGDTLKGAFVEGNNPYYKGARTYKEFATTPGASTKEVLKDAFVEGNNPARQAFTAEQQRLVDTVDIHMNAGDDYRVALVKTGTVFLSDASGGTKVAEAIMKKDSDTQTLLTTGVPRTLTTDEVIERGTYGTLQVVGNGAIVAEGLSNFRWWLRTSDKPSLGPGAASRAEFDRTLSRDLKTGKVKGTLKEVELPKDPGALKQMRDDLQESIRIRKEEQVRLGEDAGHRERIRVEESLLRRVEKKLGK